MSSYQRTVHLRSAGIAGLCATLAIAAAMVGTAAAAAVPDFGTQNFRGAQDYRAAELPAALSAAAASGQEITSALQPGQTVTSIAPGTYRGLVGDQVPWAPASGPTSALQPGQTDSTEVARDTTMSDKPYQALQVLLAATAPGASAIGPASAPQPGQTGW